MTTRHIFISLLIVFCSLSVPATSFAVPQYVVDVDMDFAVSRDIREYFDKEDFTALEEIAKDLRDNDRRFLNGSPLLAAYYEAFSMAPDTNADYEKDEGYKRSLDLLAKWKLAYPDSVTQRVAEACVWLDYAWLARGSGYADTVDEKGWVLFDKRVQKAYDLLKDAPADGAEDCPQRYASLLTVGMAQGWGKRRYDTVFDEAVSYYPGYFPIYGSKAIYLLPRWHGEPGDWQAFADEAAALAPDEDSTTAYTRVLMSTHSYGEWERFEEAGVSWPKMKQGFQDMARQYPDSAWNLNRFAYFAVLAKDRETAAMLVGRIGDKPIMRIWKKRAYYESCRTALSTGKDIPEPKRNDRRHSNPTGVGDTESLSALVKYITLLAGLVTVPGTSRWFCLSG